MKDSDTLYFNPVPSLFGGRLRDYGESQYASGETPARKHQSLAYAR